MLTMYRGITFLVFIGLLLHEGECTLDNRGTVFHVLYLGNFKTMPTLTLIISSERQTTVTVRNIYNQTNSTYDVSGMKSIFVNLIGSLAYEEDMEIRRKVVYVTSTQKISLHTMNGNDGSRDGYVVLPVTLLSNRYIAASYGISHLSVRKPVFAVSAIYENTQVRIEFKTAKATGNCSKKGYKNGETWTGILNQFEVIGTFCNTDLTGTLITSNKPLVVVSGHRCANIPTRTKYCDHLAEMMIPVELFGKTFTLHNLGGRISGAIYRIIASVEKTNITFSDGGSISLQERDFIDIDTKNTGQICVKSDRPVLVVSYAKGKNADRNRYGDPFMSIVPSTDTFGNFPFLFKMPQISGVPHKAFVTITFWSRSTFRVPQSFKGYVRTINNCDFDVATIPITDDSALLTLQSSDLEYNALVYGFTDHSGYAFPAFIVSGDGCLKGLYGSNCSLMCSTFCQENICDRVDGSCTHGCISGRKGYNCSEECPTGYFGPDCQLECSSHCANGICHPVSGRCLLGCVSGWRGTICNQTCLPGYYGTGCRNECSRNCQGGVCHHTNGTCINACISNWTGPMCNVVSECPAGLYGNKCEIKCSRYCKGDVCGRLNGTCLLGCVSGKKGKTCSEVSECPSGLYGSECDIKCSRYCKGDVCERLNGKCLLGCVSGKEGKTCSEDCFDGPGCLKPCINCEDAKCLKDTSACLYGCKPGWTGRDCATECTRGYYGPQCFLQCSKNCEGGYCHHIDGTCLNGCASGWRGEKCSQEQDNTLIITVAVVVAGVVLVAIMLFVVVVVLKRRSRNTQKSPRIPHVPKQEENVSIITPQPNYDLQGNMGADNIYHSINECTAAERAPSVIYERAGKTDDKSFRSTGYESLVQFTKGSESSYTALYKTSQ